jgi:anti-sigma factor RsiW
MNRDLELKLQACLDGEASPDEQEQIRALLDTDTEARALKAQLEYARSAFRAFGDSTRVPASREFYWSRIEREIHKGEEHGAPAPGESFSWVNWLRRALVPAGAVAAIVIVGLLASRQSAIVGSGPISLEASVSSPGAFTYRDFVNGTTLVWVSYPAEKEFADFDDDPTLP